MRTVITRSFLQKVALPSSEGSAAAPKAAEALKFSPSDLIEFGVVDRIIDEPVGGAHRDYDRAAKNMKSAIKDSLKKLKKKNLTQLLDDRYARFRKLGVFEDKAAASIFADFTNAYAIRRMPNGPSGKSRSTDSWSTLKVM